MGTLQTVCAHLLICFLSSPPSLPFLSAPPFIGSAGSFELSFYVPVLQGPLSSFWAFLQCPLRGCSNPHSPCIQALLTIPQCTKSPSNKLVSRFSLPPPDPFLHKYLRTPSTHQDRPPPFPFAQHFFFPNLNPSFPAWSIDPSPAARPRRSFPALFSLCFSPRPLCFSTRVRNIQSTVYIGSFEFVNPPRVLYPTVPPSVSPPSLGPQHPPRFLRYPSLKALANDVFSPWSFFFSVPSSPGGRTPVRLLSFPFYPCQDSPGLRPLDLSPFPDRESPSVTPPTVLTHCAHSFPFPRCFCCRSTIWSCLALFRPF